MASPVILTQLTYPDWDEFSARGKNRALKEAHFAIGRTWLARFLRLHFERGNATRYSMQRRSDRYIARKKRLAELGKVKKGGQVLLVASGALEEQIETPNIVRAFPTRATIRLFGPAYLSIRPKNPRMPDMAAEILRVIPEEKESLFAAGQVALDGATEKELARRRKTE